MLVNEVGRKLGLWHLPLQRRDISSPESVRTRSPQRGAIWNLGKSHVVILPQSPGPYALGVEKEEDPTSDQGQMIAGNPQSIRQKRGDARQNFDFLGNLRY